MKRFITIIFCLAAIGLVCYKLDYIIDKLIDLFNGHHSVVLAEKNKYAKDYDFEYVQLNETYSPYNYQELLNVFYTILNNGYNNFTFYCPNEYQDCLDDVEKISNEKNIEVLTTIGNYVKPFNNFKTIKVQYDTAGEVTIDVEHLYSEEDIMKINDKLDDIWASIVKEDMDDKAIIYAFHDYIINNTRYDQSYEKELKTGTTTHQANKANGVLFEGYAICSGYTDTMALVLDRLGLKNYKVASNTHVWNVLYIDDQWLHLDLTWDDPTGSNGQDNLLHKFYLIDTKKLEEFDIKDHTFNKSLYIELR